MKRSSECEKVEELPKDTKELWGKTSEKVEELPQDNDEDNLVKDKELWWNFLNVKNSSKNYDTWFVLWYCFLCG